MTPTASGGRGADGSSTVTVGIDGSWNSRCALKWASDEARRQGATMRILCAGGPSLKQGASWSRGATSDAGRDLLDEAEALMATRHPSLLVGTELSDEPPAAALLAASRSSQLLVVGSHGGTTVVDGPLGSVSDRCIRASACPAAVVHDDPDAHPYRSSERRIVVGVDGSPDAMGALRWALARATDTGTDTGTTLRVVIATDPWREDGGPADAEGRIADLVRACQETAAGDAPGRYEIRTRQGPVVAALCEGLEVTDLLVVGARGSTSSSDKPLGSVASRCTQDARCPVVVVRSAPADRRSPAGGARAGPDAPARAPSTDPGG